MTFHQIVLDKLWLMYIEGFEKRGVSFEKALWEHIVYLCIVATPVQWSGIMPSLSCEV